MFEYPVLVSRSSIATRTFVPTAITFLYWSQSFGVTWSTPYVIWVTCPTARFLTAHWVLGWWSWQFVQKRAGHWSADSSVGIPDCGVASTYPGSILHLVALFEAHSSDGAQKERVRSFIHSSLYWARPPVTAGVYSPVVVSSIGMSDCHGAQNFNRDFRCHVVLPR